MATFLQPDKTTTIQFPGYSPLVIKEKIIPETARAIKDCASWCLKGQKMKPCVPLAHNYPLGIVVHNTEPIAVSAQTTMAEQYTRATWPNCNMGGVVVHYYASPTDCWQNLHLTEQGWHAGDGSRVWVAHKNASCKQLGGNLDCIAVEIVGSQSEDNGAKLVAYLIKKFGLTINDVYTHNYFQAFKFNVSPTDQYIPGASKNCPAYILDHWTLFLNKVEGYLKVLNDADKATSTPATTPKTLYRVQIGAFVDKGNADAFLKDVKGKGYKDAFIQAEKSLQGKVMYKIQVGAFANKDNALNFAKEVKTYGLDAFVVTYDH